MFLARRVVELERLHSFQLLPWETSERREEKFVAEARTDDDDAVECQNSSSSLIATPLYTIGVLHREKGSQPSRRTSMRTDAGCHPPQNPAHSKRTITERYRTNYPNHDHNKITF